MKICNYTFEKFMDIVKFFHGYEAPGMIVGGFMVDYVLKNIPEGELFDAICETSSCLPDAIQLLTPCTIGNGWLRIVNLGRYALTLYDKDNGNGIRGFLDLSRMDDYSEIKSWYLKLKKKKEQDSNLLLEQIREAGSTLCSLEPVIVQSQYMEKRKKGMIAICPMCKEAYPFKDGDKCRACMGESPYL